jgi:hypothetical protein
MFFKEETVEGEEKEVNLERETIEVRKEIKLTA